MHNSRSCFTSKKDRRSFYCIYQLKKSKLVLSFMPNCQHRYIKINPFTIEGEKGKRLRIQFNSIEENTNFDRSNSKATSLKEHPNAASSDSFPKSTNNTTCHQHVLHPSQFFLMLLDKVRSSSAATCKDDNNFSTLRHTQRFSTSKHHSHLFNLEKIYNLNFLHKLLFQFKQYYNNFYKNL